MTYEHMPPQTGPSILVVEDDTEIREFYVLLLTEAGYQVHDAGTGHEGLAQLDSGSGPLHAAVVDLGLPDMDGYTLCRRLCERMPPGFPILIATASIEPNYELQARDAGATAFLRKPFRPEDLLNCLAGILREPVTD